MDVFYGLKSQEADLVMELIETLRLKEQSFINPCSDFCCDRFSEDFVSRLKVYHALNDDILKKKTFEFAFARSLNSCGTTASVSMNSVHPGEDVLAGGTKYSLKTEASASISLSSITISKLMEARWIRECITKADFLYGVLNNVVSHLKRYDRILILRAFRQSDSYRYRLVEIPVSVLLGMSNLSADEFTTRTKNGSCRAVVHINGEFAFCLSLDGSVEKVTITRLREDLCTLHGEWIIPLRNVLEKRVD